uniref:NADH dehydrogenase subunit 2 n=1 Tax=Neogoniolithon spectabile TaxID=231755 RepID=A0A3G3MIK2_9FLOR|nr:NADH dehydrogenase subunit 2 [Neogoniolithon spectabile]AYR06666.1 NADH dehydrogenase subunit 2 [Neogoniolithon spectabile]
MLNFLFDTYLTIPEINLILGTLSLLTFGVLLGNSKRFGYPLLSKSLRALTVQILIIGIYLYSKFPYNSYISWNSLFFCDFSCTILKTTLLFLMLLWTYFSTYYIKEEKINTFEYWILILFSLCAFIFLFQVYDLLSLYLLLELQTISFYILASYKRNSEFSTEAGIKYFVAGAFSSALLLLGCSLLYGIFGSTNFEDFNILFMSLPNKIMTVYKNSILISLVFLYSSLLFKVGAAPFHMWVPDVYEGSPTITTSFFAIFPKLAIFSILIRLCFFSFNNLFNTWLYLFFITSLISLTLGSLGALMQLKWKRLIAYSSISHVGFILIGFLMGDQIGITSIYLYLYIYMITNFGVFSILTGFRVLKHPFWYQIRFFNELKSISILNPILAISLTIILFSMAGIPPLAGFFAKLFILIPGVQSNSYFLVIIAVLMSCLSSFYYIRIIQILYFSKTVRLIFFTFPEQGSLLHIGIHVFYFIIFLFWFRIILFTY